MSPVRVNVAISDPMASQPIAFLTPEQYLEIERKAERKSEYWRGEMFAMAGATREHNLVVLNAASEAREKLRSKSCEVYAADMRVRVEHSGLYTYPDVVIVCGGPQFLDDRRDTLLNPAVIIEVLSPSTEAYDRGRKFEQYRSIPSLRQYLLLAQERMHADLYTRQNEGQWLLTSASCGEDFVELASVECRLPLSGCYERVDFETASRA